MRKVPLGLDSDSDWSEDDLPPLVESSDSSDDGLDGMEALVAIKRRRPRDADLAERARTFKAAKIALRGKEEMRVTLENARGKLRDLRPGIFTTFVPSDICLQGFTRAYKGSKLSDQYHKLQNFILSLLASAIEHTQDRGLEEELQRAVAHTQAGGSVVLGSELMYDETNQRLSVPPEFAKGRVRGVGGQLATNEHGRIRNMTCPVLVRSGCVCFEYIPAGDSDVGVLGSSSSHAHRQVFQSPIVQPWIFRPQVIHGKGMMFMLRALSSRWPLHVSCARFAELWETYIYNGVKVLVDVDNRDDANNNRSYVAQAAGEAQQFFERTGCPHRQVRYSHRCDIHQVVFRNNLSRIKISITLWDVGGAGRDAAQSYLVVWVVGVGNRRVQR